MTSHAAVQARGGYVSVLPDLCCNNDCIFCYESYHEKNPRGHATPAEIVEKTLKLVNETGWDRVVISGGEPTLYSGLREVVRQLKDHGLFVTLFTNGRVLHEKAKTEQLVVAGVDAFHIPVHSDSERIHDAITRSEGSFRETITGISNLKEARSYASFTLSFVHVLNRLNYLGLSQFARFISEFRPDYILLSYCVVNLDSPKDHLKILASYHEAACAIDDAYEIFEDKGQRVFVENIPPCVLRGKEALCMDFFKFNFLDIRGFKAVSTADGKTFVPLKQSIKSDQRAYAPACESCCIKQYCGGLHRASLEFQGSKHIVPYTAEEIRARLAASS
ncbi:MAG: radical SAM protein [Desulfomonilaceae bacterium]|nr:radical SAM protein [Desulfomonilaceae bacterium]